MMKIERTDDHRYFVTQRGRRIECASVTRSLVAAGMVDDEYLTEAGRRRGQMVSKFAEKIATGQRGVEIPSEIVGWMSGFRRFLDKYQPVISGAEVLRADPARLLAGAVDLEIDRMAIFDGCDGITGDIKTGSPEPWHGLQLAAYAYLKAKHRWIHQRRVGIYLTAVGGFRVLEYDNSYDLDDFFRCHDMLLWRIQRGTWEKPYGRSEQRSTGYRAVVLDIDRDGRTDFDGDSRRWF